MVHLDKIIILKVFVTLSAQRYSYNDQIQVDALNIDGLYTVVRIVFVENIRVIDM